MCIYIYMIYVHMYMYSYWCSPEQMAPWPKSKIFRAIGRNM